MPANKHEIEEFKIRNAAHQIMEQTAYPRTFTLGELDDFVLCMHCTVHDMDMNIKMIEEHVEECFDEECVEMCKERLKFLKHKRDQLRERVSSVGPTLAQHKERIEFLLAKHYGALRPPDETWEDKDDTETGEGFHHSH